MYKNEFQSSLYYLGDKKRHGLEKLPLVSDIKIIDNIAQKIDVYVNMTKLVEGVAEGETRIAYETNVTNINKVFTSLDDLKLDFTDEKQATYTSSCILNKYDDNPLLIVCFPPNTEKSWLKETEDVKVLENANIRHNPKILPIKNKEIINFSKKDEGASIMWFYPKELNFTEKDNLYIDYASEGEKELKGMTLNEDKDDLKCEIRKNDLLRCTVPKSHFEGKKSGNYFTKHANHLNGTSTNYEIPPIKVILSDSPDPKPSKGNILPFSLFYLSLLILILF